MFNIYRYYHHGEASASTKRQIPNFAKSYDESIWCNAEIQLANKVETGQSTYSRIAWQKRHDSSPEEGSILAKVIPNAKLVYLEKSNHFLEEEMEEVISHHKVSSLASSLFYALGTSLKSGFWFCGKVIAEPKDILLLVLKKMVKE